jgi:hypothetical protein
MNIFIKNKELLYNDVKAVIPKNSLLIPIDENSRSNKIEYRWRFIEFNGNKSVEISRSIDKNREYINKEGEWVKRYIDSKFDKFVKESYYYYIDK